MKTLFAVVLLALASTAGAESLEKIQERGAIEVAVYRDFPPYSYNQNGKPFGIDVDIAKALAEKLGVTAYFRLVGADENMSDDLRNNVWKGHYLGGGTADMMMHVPYHPEYSEKEDLVLFLTPYYQEKIVILYDPEQMSPPENIDPFLTHTVGVELDTLADFYLLGSKQGKLIANVVHYRNVTRAVDGLRNGEVAAVMAPGGELGAAINADEKYRIADLELENFASGMWNLGVGVKFKFKSLAEQLELAMNELHNSGAIKDIFENHGVLYRPSAQ